MVEKLDPLIGQTLEKVRLTQKLGSGGMGTVYLAEHATLDKKVAVKILPEHLSRDPEYVSRFRAEAQTAFGLQHPGVVRVHDIGYADGKYFIVMQYIEGESLQKIVNTLGPLDPRDAAKLMIGVLRALHYAHSMGIVHRDIKPDNIIVQKNNQPVITDFGLAFETDTSLKYTAAGTVVGTPWFISPEQANGQRADYRSDLYSLGVTLYFLVAGRVPFTAQGALAVLNKHINEPPVAPSIFNPRISPVMDAVILKFLAKKPEERYRTAELAARDLEAFLDNKPISTTRPSSMTVPRATRIERRPYGWAAGLSAFAAVVAVVVVAIASRQQPTPPPLKGGSTADQPPPAVDEEIQSARLRLADIEEKFDNERGDFGTYPYHNNRYDLERRGFAGHAGAMKIIEESYGRFLEKIETRAKPLAEKAAARVAALLPTDPYGALQAYGDFPRALLEICATGRQVADAKSRLEAKLARDVPVEFESIQRGIDEEDFERAAARIAYLLNHLGSDDRQKLRELQTLADGREKELREQMEPRLEAEAADIEKRLLDPLSRGRTAEAWQILVQYVASKPANRLEARAIRVRGVDYASLAAFKIDQAIDGEIERLLKVLSGAQAGADPAFRLLLLHEDVVRREWLQRRVAKGIERASGAVLELQSAGRVRITAGSPPQVAPESGPPRALETRELPPADLALLAACADHPADEAIAEALRSNERVCAAAGVAYLYSTTRDRIHAAKRWFDRAHALGSSVPRFRMEALEEQAKIEEERLVREIFSVAHALADQGQFEAAQRAIDEVEKKHKDQEMMQTLAPSIERHRAKFLLKEANAAKAARNWARVREIVVKHLRKKFEGYYDRETGDRLYHEALLNTGSWQNAPIHDLAKSTFWTWYNKAEGAPAPAKLSDGGIRLTRNLPILAVRDKTEGTTGISAKIRLNERRLPFQAGIHFDVDNDRGTEKIVRVTSTGEVGYYSIVNRAEDKRDMHDLPAKVEVGTWVELAVVAEEGEIVIYVNREPVFAVQGAVDPKGWLGFGAEGDFTFKEIRLRK